MEEPDLSRNSDFYLIKSKKKTEVLVYGGREFYKKRVNKDNSIVWRCAKAPSCYAIIKTRDKAIIEGTDHKAHCQANEAKLFIKKTMNCLKEKVQTAEGRPIQQIYEEEVLAIRDRGIDFIETIPTFKNVCGALYRCRNSNQNVQRTVFRNKSEVEIPRDYEKFLLFDYEDVGERIIAFATEEAKLRMNKIEMYFGDGTFKCCIKPFMQLYVIHGDMGSSENTTNVTPLIYCLLLTKKKSTYVTLFQLIKSQIPAWKPREFQTDFEPAVMNALKIVSPETKSKACYFHFCQALQRKGKKLNLTKQIHTKRHISLLMALPLIPEELVDEGFLYIMEDCPSDVNTTKFNDYFVGTYLHGGKYPPSLWSVHRRRHRTTNALECWHATLNRFVAKKKALNMLQFLTILHRDAQMQNVRYASPTTSGDRPRNAAILERDKKISSALDDLSFGKISVGHCIEKLAPFSK